LKKLLSIAILAVVCSCIAVYTAKSVHAQSLTLTDTSNIDASSTKTWPAGPYSRVLTNYGVLQTCIPLFDIKGPGNTSLSCSIYNRTNQDGVAPGQNLIQGASAEGGAGMGWECSALSNVSVGSLDPGNRNSIVQSAPGNVVSYWPISLENALGVPTIYNRDPGVRADPQPLVGSGGTLTGVDITNQSDKSVFNYSQPITYSPGISVSNYYLTSVTDTHGNSVNYTYTLFGLQYLPTQVTDATGKRSYTINYVVDPSGASTNEQISSIVLNCYGSTREWDFNYTSETAGPLLYSITFPAPVTGGSRPTVQFAYDGSSNITDLYDLKGNHWQYGYSFGYQNPYNSPPVYQIVVDAVTNPANNGNAASSSFSYSTTFRNVTGSTYVSVSNICYIYDQNSNRYSYTYWFDDDVHNSVYLPSPIESTQDPYDSWNSDDVYYSDSYTWNLYDNTLSSYTDKSGYKTAFTYDGNNHGDMLTKTDPLSNVTTYRYNSNDKLLTTIDPNLNRVINSYNSTQDLIQTIVDPKTDPNDSTFSNPNGVALTTNYTYSSIGQLASSWNGSDQPTIYSNFDYFGNAQTVTPPSGNSTTNASKFTFDAFNNKTSDAEPSPTGTSNYTYDNWNRLTTVTNPDSTTNSKVYDNDSNVTQEIDENGHTTTTTYDGLNHPIEVDRQVDSSPGDDIINYEYYDAVGDRTSIVNGQNETTIYTYDQRRELVETNYPDGEYRECDYNGDGKVIWSTDYNGYHTTYTYDADDRLTYTNFHDGTAYLNTWRSDGIRTALADSTGTTSWTVNGAKQITQVIEPASGATLTYTYDSSGRKKTLKYGAQTWTYNYDSFNRPSSVGQSIGDATPVSFAYNLNSSIQQETLGAGGLSTAYTYDTRGRTLGILNKLSTATQQQTAYTYDGVGNVNTYQDDITGGASMTTTYGYDYANRLISEVRTGGATYNNSYAYDKDGNRKSVTRNGTTNFYTVDSNDKFLSGDGYTVPSYNFHGDPTALQGCGTTSTYQFTYDLSDRPTMLLLPGSIPVSYTYDGDGHRVSKRVGSQTTYYVYDGDTVVAEVAPTAAITYELPGIGYVSPNGSVITQSYYQDNSQGSTLSVRGSTGTLQSQNEYDAYGISYPLVAGPHTDFGYVGSKSYVTDTETGLLELGHRYYLPILGRFLTQDPSGQKDDLNLYAYCHENPVTGIDPEGLTTFSFGNWTDAEIGILFGVLGVGGGAGNGWSIDTAGTFSIWGSGQIQVGVGDSAETGPEFGISPGNTFVGPNGFGGSASLLPGLGGQAGPFEVQQSVVPRWFNNWWSRHLMYPGGSGSHSTSGSVGVGAGLSFFGFLNGSGNFSVNIPTVASGIANQVQNFYKQLMHTPGPSFDFSQ